MPMPRGCCSGLALEAATKVRAARPAPAEAAWRRSPARIPMSRTQAAMGR
jgi:hypothetical protein